MEMTYKLDTEKIDGTEYVTGYHYDPAGNELPAGAESITQWRDEEGNPLWMLKGNTMIAAPARVLPPEEIAAKKAKSFESLIPAMLIEVVKSTGGPEESWKALDAAVRELLNGNGGKA